MYLFIYNVPAYRIYVDVMLYDVILMLMFLFHVDVMAENKEARSDLSETR